MKFNRALPLAIVLLFLSISFLNAQTSYYWVGGTGNWDDVSHWATSSGGTTFHASPPTSTNDVFFDQNSFTDELESVTIPNTLSFAECRDMNWMGINFVSRLNSSFRNVNVHGDLQMSPLLNLSNFSGDFVLVANEASDLFTENISSIGRFTSFSFVGNGPFTLQDSIKSGEISLSNSAILDLNDQYVNLSEFSIQSGFDGEISMGSSEVRMSSFNNSSTNNFTFSRETSSLYISRRFFSNNALIAYGDVVFEHFTDNINTEPRIFYTSNTVADANFGQVTIEAGVELIIEENVNFNVDQLIAQGKRDSLITIRSALPGTTSSIIQTLGTVEGLFLNLTDITASGGATFNANNSNDNGNNMGWNFTPITPLTYYWVGGGGNWSDLTHWATSSGGSVLHETVPTAIDDVFFDENSFSENGETVNMDIDGHCLNIDWTGVTFTNNFRGGFRETLSVFGNFALTNTTNFSSFSSDIDFLASEEVEIFMGSNASFRNTIDINFRGTGPFQIRDNANSGSFNLLNNAIFNLNGNNWEVDGFDISSNFRGTLNIASSELHTVDFNNNNRDTDDNFQLVDDFSKIFVSRFLSTRDPSFVYHHILAEGTGTTRFLNGTIFEIDSLTLLPGSTLLVPGGSTVNVGILTATGERDEPITIQSTNAGSTATISQAMGDVDGIFLRIQDIIATGGATFNAEQSVDNGNNTGWNFTALTPLNFYWVGDGGDWDDPSHWATTSGGTTLHTTIPTVIDDVFFDENSFTTTNQTVTLTQDVSECHDMDWTGVQFSPAINEIGRGNDLNIHGNFIMNSTVRYSGLFLINFLANEPVSIFTGKNRTLNGGTRDEESFHFLGDGPFVVEDSVLSGGLFFRNNATVEIVGKYVDVPDINIDRNFSGNINFNSSEFHVERFSNNNNEATEDFIFSNNQAKIYVDRQFSGEDPDYLYNHVILERSRFSSGVQYSTGNQADVSFDTLAILPGVTFTVREGVNVNIDHLVAVGERTNPIVIQTNSAGQESTFVQTEGTVDGMFLDLRDIHAGGGATFNANSSVDNGNNDGWIFTAQPSLEYFWVGGAGNWDDVAHWATSSGGNEFYTNPPSRADNVHFDENSFPEPRATVRLGAANECRDMDWSRVTNNPNISASNFTIQMNIHGSLTLSNELNLANMRTDWRFLANEQVDFFTGNNRTLSNSSDFNFIGEGPFNLMDSVLSGGISTNTASSLNLNGQFLDINSMELNGGARLDMSSTEIHTNFFRINASSTLEVIADRSNLYIEGSMNAGGAYTFGNIIFENNDRASTLFGVNNFSELVISMDSLILGNGTELTIRRGGVVNVNQLIANGSRVAPISIRSSEAGENVTINQTGGTVNANFLDLLDIHAAGGAVFNANNSIDNGNNDGWNFTVPQSLDFYWVGDAGDWEDFENHWATSSGGSTFHTSVPTRIDNVFFDENSFSASGQYVNISEEAFCANFIGDVILAGTGISQATGVNQPLRIFGNFSVSEGFNFARFNSNIEFESSQNVQLASGNNRSFLNNTSLSFLGAGPFILQDSLLSGNIIVDNGAILDLNDQYIDINTLSIRTNYAGELDLSSSTVKVNRFANNHRSFSPANFDLLADDSWLVVRDRFSTSESRVNYGNVIFDNSGGSVAYLGTLGTQSSNYDSLVVTAGTSVIIDDFATLTANQFVLQGSAEQPITIQSNRGGSTATLSQPIGIVDGTNLVLMDMTASGGAVFNAINSTDNGNNEGWIFLTDDEAPLFVESTPLVLEITGNSVDLNVALDEIGSVFYVLLADGEPVPTSLQITSGIDAEGNAFDIAGEIQISEANTVFQQAILGIDPLTSQNLYVLGVDISANVQSDVTVIEFDTPRGNQTLSLEETNPLRFGDAPFNLVASSTSGLPVTITSSDDGILNITGNTATINGIGDVTITLNQEGNDAYFPVTQNFDLTIGKRLLMASAVDVEKVYFEENPTLTIAYDGFLNTDTESVLTNAPQISTSALLSSDAGTYPISLTEGNDEIYEILNQEGTLTVNKAILSVTTEDVSRTYRSENPDFTLLFNGFVNNESQSVLDVLPQITTNATATSDVGTYDIVISEEMDNNYTINVENGTLTVTQAQLTASVGNFERVYGTENPEFTVQYTGFLNDENINVIDNPLVPQLAANTLSDAGSYPITFTGGTDNNYEILSTNGLLTVTRAPLTGTISNASRLYGEENPTFDISYEGFVNDDSESDLDNIPQISTTAATISDVGEYALSASPTTDTNYEISFENGILTVGQADLMVSADDQTVQVNQALPTLTISYTGFVNEDEASDLDELPEISTTATNGSPSGEYPITLSGGIDNNYNLVLENGTLSIVDFLPQTITVDEIPALTYGDEDLIIMTSASSDLPVTITSSDAAIATVNGNTLEILNAGTVNLVFSQGGSELYAAAPEVTREIIIDQAIITATANDQTRVVSLANPELTISYEGFVNGDELADLDELPTASTLATEDSPADEYAITLSGGTDNNYDFNLVDGTLSVTPLLAQSITFVEIEDRTFGDESFELMATASSELPVSYSVSNEDIVRLEGNTITILQAGFVTITAVQEGNEIYAAAEESSQVIEINKAVLTVTADDQARRLGNENPVLTISYNGFINDDDVSDLTEEPEISTSATIDSPVGEYPIVLSGGTDENYEFVLNSGVLLVTELEAQTINFDVLPSVTYGDPSFEINATATSDLSVSFRSSNENIASIDGNTITILQAGSVSITASQDGNTEFSPARNVSQELVIEKAIISASADNQIRRVSNPNPDLTISYSGFVNNDVLADLDELPVASTNASLVSPAGNYTITLNGGFDNNYEFQLIEGLLTVTILEPQVITFDPIAARTYGGENFNLIASANSDLPVSFSSSDPSVATVIGTEVIIVNAGIVVINASQSGNEDFSPAQNVAQVLVINRAELIVTADNQSKMLGEENPVLTFSYDGFVNGDNVTDLIEEPTITTTAETNSLAGEYAIVLNGGIAENYDFELINGVLTVEGLLDQNLSFSEVADRTFGDEAFMLNATSSTDQPIIFSSSDESIVSINNNIATILSAGAVTLSARQEGNNQFNMALVSQDILINRAAQTITFQSISDVNADQEIVELIASSTAGLDINFQLITGPATLINNNLQLEGVGTIRVSANQSGNNNYLAAESVVQEFEVFAVTSSDVSATQTFKVFPNPFTEFISIDVSNREALKIKILNLNGKLIETKNIGYDQSRVDLQHLSAGTYVALILTQDNEIVKKMILVKQL